MPRLLLLRHAKAEPSDALTMDHARPLAPAGQKSAAEMGRLMRSAGLLPDYALISSALRTLETWQALSLQNEARLLHGLYLASATTILDILRAEAGPAECVLLVGHNPGLHEAALHLAEFSSVSDTARMRLGEDFPVASLAVFAIDGAWTNLSPRHSRLLRYHVSVTGLDGRASGTA